SKRQWQQVSRAAPQPLLRVGFFALWAAAATPTPFVAAPVGPPPTPFRPPPPPRRFRFPGRKPLDCRHTLTGILFVLKTGINWEDLPAELGWGCGKTCKKYLEARYRSGVWQRLRHALLQELQDADRIDWSSAAVD